MLAIIGKSRDLVGESLWANAFGSALGNHIVAGLSKTTRVELTQQEKEALSYFPDNEKKIMEKLLNQGHSFSEANQMTLSAVMGAPEMGSNLTASLRGDYYDQLNGVGTLSTDLPVETQIAGMNAGLSHAEIGGIRDNALALQNQSKDFLEYALLFESNDSAFGDLVNDIRVNGFESKYAVLGHLALRSSDNDFLADSILNNRANFIGTIRERAGIAGALSERVATLTNNTGNSFVDSLGSDTIDFFSNPQGVEGISRGTFDTMYASGLIDFETYDQVGYQAFESMAGRIEGKLAIATLGASILLNPKSALNGARSLLGMGASALKLGASQALRLGNAFSGKFRAMGSNLVGKMRGSSATIPKGGSSIQSRISQGKTVPEYARKNPNAYYYDGGVGKYKTIPEVKPNFSVGMSGREIPCFVAGTQVATPNSQSYIEDLVVGDLVLSWDDNSKRVVENKVTALHSNKAIEWVTIKTKDDMIVTTRNHRFWDNGREEWVEAKYLEVGTQLLLESGQTSLVEQVLMNNSTEASTFNITVENAHNYFVGSSRVLVHNDGIDINGKIYIGYIDKNPVYVGQTLQTLTARQSQHIAEGGWKSSMTIKQYPGLDGLSPDQMNYHERRIYDEMRDRGFELKNGQVPLTDSKVNSLVKKYC